jgi:hypothetical protein
VERCPEEAIDDDDEEDGLISRVDMLGELETLFRDRGCNGD